MRLLASHPTQSNPHISHKLKNASNPFITPLLESLSVTFNALAPVPVPVVAVVVAVAVAAAVAAAVAVAVAVAVVEN